MRYIGSKVRILDFISNTIHQTFGSLKGRIVADLFSGTSCVAEMFKKHSAKIISNDYLWFSYALQIAKIKFNTPPNSFSYYEDLLQYLNSLSGKKGFFYKNYTMEATMNNFYKRNYFSSENAQKIDSICSKLEFWKNNNIISQDTFFLLSASLVDAITKVSNTSGTYGAFLKIDDPRKYKALKLLPFEFYDNGFDNKVYCKDVLSLINEVEGDVLYLDPPYNSRQYPPYYHILETAVLYDNPNIYGITGRRPYDNALSPFCMKNKALISMMELVKKAKFNNVYISYNTDGIISLKEFSEYLTKFGKVSIFQKNFRRYKSNSGGIFTNPVKEIIVYVQKNIA